MKTIRLKTLNFIKSIKICFHSKQVNQLLSVLNHYIGGFSVIHKCFSTYFSKTRNGFYTADT